MNATPNVSGLLIRTSAALCGLLAGLALLATTAAHATVVHRFATSFGEAGSGPGQFNDPFGIAVNDSTTLEPTSGDVYVVDAGNDRVERFSAAGAYLGQFDGSGSYEVEKRQVESGPPAAKGRLFEPTAIAVDNSGNPLDPSEGDVYVADSGHGVVDKFTATGNYVGEITGEGTPGGNFGAGDFGGAGSRTVFGVAVDNSGVVSVTLTGSGIVRFEDQPTNRYLPPEIKPVIAPNYGLAVDGAGDFYSISGAYQKEGLALTKYSNSGEVLAELFGEDGYAENVAVDASRAEVYLDSFDSRGLGTPLSNIEAFDVSGAPIESSSGASQFPPFGEGHVGFARGIAVNASSGVVYAANSTYPGEANVDDVAIFEALALPTVSLTPPSGQQPRSLTLNGMVNPEGREVTSCFFEYDTAPYAQGEAGHGSKVACVPQGSLGAGVSTAVSVSASLSGLMPQTIYYYRLVAGNAIGESDTVGGAELFTGPQIGDEYTSDVASSSATLLSSLEPKGADTHYYFEYGTSVAYGSFAPLPAPGVDAGASTGAETMRTHLQGLQQGVTYHYRLVAVQAGEEFFGPDREFQTEGANTTAEAPDGRTWELVSPAEKRGALIEPIEQGGQVQAAADGSGIAYITRGSSLSEGASGKQSFSQALSRRDAEGNWITEDITLPQRMPENGEGTSGIQSSSMEYKLFSPNLDEAATQSETAGTPPLALGATEHEVYLRRDDSREYVPLVTSENVPSGAQIELDPFSGFAWAMKFLGATPDLKHVVFETPAALTSEAVVEESAIGQRAEEEMVQWNLYEWVEGELRLVNILPGSGGVAHGRHAAGVPGVRLAGLVAGANNSITGGAPRAISNDGQRIAWTWGAPNPPFFEEAASPYRGLFVRDMDEERTVRVGGADAIYQTMNAEGTQIFYLENGELYDYEWEGGAEKGASVDLTATHEAGEASAHVQESVSDVSENGAYVYLVAKGVLAPGGRQGEDNLYLLQNAGEGWKATFVASLAAEDEPSWHRLGGGRAPSLSISSRVSPNGHFLAFMSMRSLTGYDNTDINSGAHDEEVYLYEAQTGRLVCASCDPTGARPAGAFDSSQMPLEADPLEAWTDNDTMPADVRANHWLAGMIPTWDTLNATGLSTYQPRYLSNSGRMFFDSPVGLVPTDTNGVEDVYEFEPEGVGNCVAGLTSARQVYVKEEQGHPLDGCLAIISSGASASESVFYDASEDGNDVFFNTAAKLIGADLDGGYDIYDAHVCNAEPCAGTIEASPPCASGDDCKPAPAPQPAVFGSPPSATFEGIGNPVYSPSAASKSRPASKAQKLRRALSRCHSKRRRRRRVACEAQARRRYPVKAGKAQAR